MKKLIIIPFVLLSYIVQAQSYVVVKPSQLPAAGTINLTDLFILNQGTTTKKVTYSILNGVLKDTFATKNVFEDSVAALRSDIGSGGGNPFEYIQYDTLPIVQPYEKGIRYWDTLHNTTSLYVGNGATLQDGQELHLYCQNNSGSQIDNGKAVYIINSGGETPRIRLASNAAINTAYRFIGVTTQDIPHGSNGFVTVYGKIHDINTNGMIEGSEIYLTTSGNWSQTKPTNAHIIKVGIVTYAHASNGIILVSPDYCTQPAFKVLNNQANTGISLDTTKLKVFNNAGDSTIIDATGGQRWYENGVKIAELTNTGYLFPEI